MGLGLIIALIVIAVAAVGGYMYLYGGLPSLSLPEGVTQTVASTAGSLIDDSGATTAATSAETVANETASEIGAADNLEVPDVQ